MTAPLKNRDLSLTSAEPLTRRTVGSPASHAHRLMHEPLREHAKKTLRVMKFGGTSVADASAIEKVVQIIRAAARESDIVVVVSAMSGVTNKLVEAATEAEVGNDECVAKIFEELRLRHSAAANVLIPSTEKRQPYLRKIQEHLQEGVRLCQDASLHRELALRERDAISGLGERLLAPLVAATLAERGVRSEAIDATEIVVTDSCHGAAEPFMDLTRDRCEARLRPLLLQGIVAVVTGFIGATVDGVPTTLGRNSSDFSGTIMGAALDADEVTLWTDVDGILSADPKLVPGARPILEMSYHEASRLADLGAKVLHPKTMHALMQKGIPLAIRNTFAPDRPGTKITPTGSSNGTKVQALTATNNVALIVVRASNDLVAPGVLRRALATVATVPADMRLIPQSSLSPNDVCIVLSSASAEAAVAALRREFSKNSVSETVRDITLNPASALVTVVAGEVFEADGFITRTLNALDRERVRVLASEPDYSECTFTFVVAQEDVKLALVTAHRELQLSGVNSLTLPRKTN
jgi:bifunctional aspartokinase / homoserine dehydrogenase 1